MVQIKFLIVIIIIIAVTIPAAKATEPIMITLSDKMNQVVFDGKWTFYTEWKPSSLNTISYDDGTLIQLRSAHHDNFIYILIDEVSKTKNNDNADMAMICFDKNNSKAITPNKNDYCFGVPFNGNNAFTLRANSSLEETNHFTKIQNPDGFIGISSISDENDRYSDVPHASYEFRIPTDVVGRSDDYGFYLGVYDANENHVYSWPQDVSTDSLSNIPTPNNWGEIISPDKSLPEFPWPILAFLFSTIPIIFLRGRFSYS